jgi:LIM domain kinase 1
LSIVSTAAATDGGSIMRTLPLVHRFTLIRPGAKRSGANAGSPGLMHVHGRGNDHPVAIESHAVGWNPLDIFFSSALFVTKCDICMKRLGWKPVLECDDCGLRSVDPNIPNTIH